MGSAICSFTLADIQAAFDGKFKEQVRQTNYPSGRNHSK